MLIHCPECENGCSEDAAVCPKCGHPLKASLLARMYAALVGGVRKRMTPIAMDRSPTTGAGYWPKLAGAAAVFLVGVTLLGNTVWSIRDQRLRQEEGRRRSIAASTARDREARELTERVIADGAATHAAWIAKHGELMTLPGTDSEEADVVDSGVEDDCEEDEFVIDDAWGSAAFDDPIETLTSSQKLRIERISRHANVGTYIPSKEDLLFDLGEAEEVSRLYPMIDDHYVDEVVGWTSGSAFGVSGRSVLSVAHGLYDAITPCKPPGIDTAPWLWPRIFRKRMELYMETIDEDVQLYNDIKNRFPILSERSVGRMVGLTAGLGFDVEKRVDLVIIDDRFNTITVRRCAVRSNENVIVHLERKLVSYRQRIREFRERLATVDQ